ncbi:hypothetical protein LWM68_17910 [Niabella sp. W65]|nr:hypothetical protein [Niabella sp. W65]MCH7364457.1 hypothetical protein [Niabella sp. W65]ULT40321.1 hypothetical protein KRR40_36795 [Niabella sp. I65]
MRSEVEKADAGLLYQLKDRKRRFIILEPHQNIKAPADEPGKCTLSLNHYDALVKARAHSKRLKGKYTFIFDLENESHFYKLQQLLGDSSSFDVYVALNTDEFAGTQMAPLK